MATYEVWTGIDRLPFFENAILLEYRSRSQGEPLQSCSLMNGKVTGLESAKVPVPLATEARDFLDDFALVAAGSGGPENVSATCMELSGEDDLAVIVRVARNEGVSDEMLCSLRNIVKEVIESNTVG